MADPNVETLLADYLDANGWFWLDTNSPGVIAGIRDLADVIEDYYGVSGLESPGRVNPHPSAARPSDSRGDSVPGYSSATDHHRNHPEETR